MSVSHPVVFNVFLCERFRTARHKIRCLKTKSNQIDSHALPSHCDSQHGANLFLETSSTPWLSVYSSSLEGESRRQLTPQKSYSSSRPKPGGDIDAVIPHFILYHCQKTAMQTQYIQLNTNCASLFLWILSFVQEMLRFNQIILNRSIVTTGATTQRTIKLFDWSSH